MIKYLQHKKHIEIGRLGVLIKHENEQYYLATYNFYEEYDWQEIPEYVFAALLIFAKEGV